MWDQCRGRAQVALGEDCWWEERKSKFKEQCGPTTPQAGWPLNHNPQTGGGWGPAGSQELHFVLTLVISQHASRQTPEKFSPLRSLVVFLLFLVLVFLLLFGSLAFRSTSLRHNCLLVTYPCPSVHVQWWSSHKWTPSAGVKRRIQRTTSRQSPPRFSAILRTKKLTVHDDNWTSSYSLCRVFSLSPTRLTLPAHTCSLVSLRNPVLKSLSLQSLWLGSRRMLQ